MWYQSSTRSQRNTKRNLNDAGKKQRKRTEDFLARFGSDECATDSNEHELLETWGDNGGQPGKHAECSRARNCQRTEGRAQRERERDEGQILTMVKFVFHPFVTVVTAWQDGPVMSPIHSYIHRLQPVVFGFPTSGLSVPFADGCGLQFFIRQKVSFFFLSFFFSFLKKKSLVVFYLGVGYVVNSFGNFCSINLLLWFIICWIKVFTQILYKANILLAKWVF